MSIANEIGGAAGRAGRSLSLRMRLDSLYGQRKECAAQLGSKMYEIAKDDVSIRFHCEDLFRNIDDIDFQCESVRAELSRLDSPVQTNKVCPNPECGAALSPDARFCHICGAKIEIAFAEGESPEKSSAGTSHAILSVEEPHNTVGDVPIPADTEFTLCPICGQPVPLSDRFCMKCGQNVGSRASSKRGPANKGDSVAASPEPINAECPRCHAPIQPAYRYCGKCAMKLK